ncbi:MAG: hypothetical protein ACPGNV_10315 [Mangrovicoccus sp.]
MNSLLKPLAISALALAAASAHASTFSFYSPQDLQSLKIGDSFSVKLAFQPSATENVTAFLSNLSFEEAMLSYDGADFNPGFAPFLNVPYGSLDSTVGSRRKLTGIGANVFFSPAISGASIEIISFNFTAKMAGTGVISIDELTIASLHSEHVSSANSSLDFTILSAPMANVPLPASLPLALAGLAGLAGLRRRA